MKPKTLYRPKQLWMVISMCVFVNFSAFTQNDGSKDRPFTVQEAILYQDRPGSFWVKGYLSGCVRTNGALITDPNLFVTTNVALGSDPQGTTYLSVQLLAGDARNAINLVDNPINRYQPALIYGTLSRYCNIPGIRDVKTYLHFYLPNAPKSKDATLKSLKVGTETIPLIPGQLVYQARSAAFKTTEIEVVAVTNNYYATIVQGNGKHPLEIGENTIRIVVIAEDHTEKVYEVHLIRLCNAPEITRQPAETPACRGSNHTFQVRATGDQISYQWLKDDVIIPDATNNSFTLYDTDLEKDFGFYSVIVNGACGSVQSDVIRLWVANPMPATLTLQVPDTAVIGQRYQLHVGYVYGYADVTNYRWTFSNANIDFLNDEGPNLHTTWAVFGPVAQTGTVRVSMTHVCGTRSISRQVRVINPKPVPTAIQELGSDSPDEIFLYPNPVKYELTVDNGEMIIKNMKVVDLTGRLMYQTEPNSPVFQLSVRSIPKGTYLIKITTEKSEDTKKIIVSR